MKASQHLLLGGGYPNPDRVGCPNDSVLKGLAERKTDTREAEYLILHLGSCSPCFIEYTRFRKQRARRNALEFALASAALLFVAILGGWMWKIERTKGSKPNLATTAPEKVTVDLRNRLVFRDDRLPSGNSGPIQLRSEHLDVTMLLPAGSKPGNYTVEVLDVSEKTVLSTSGTAVNESGLTPLNVKLDLSKLSSGNYVLALEGGGERREYPLIVQ